MSERFQQLRDAGEISDTDFADWQEIQAAAARIGNRAELLLRQVVPQRIDGRRPDVTERLEDNRKFANCDHPGWETLCEFAHSDTLKDSDGPYHRMRADVETQVTSLVRGDTQEYLSASIENIWRTHAPLRRSDAILLPQEAHYNVGTNVDTAMIGDTVWDKVPMAEFAQCLETDNPDHLALALKHLSLVSIWEIMEQGMQSEVYSRKYHEAWDALKLIERSPQQVIVEGFGAGAASDLEQLHFVVTEFAKTCPVQALTDKLFDLIAKRHLELQKRFTSFGLRSFSAVSFVTKEVYSPDMMAVLERVYSHKHRGSMKMSMEDGVTHLYKGLKRNYAKLRFSKEGQVPLFDFHVPAFTPQELTRIRRRETRRGCPAIAIIPEFLEWLHQLYKYGVLPAVRKKYG